MALTQSQWYDKLKQFLPKWFFEQENLQAAHVQAVAKVLEQLQSDVDDHIAATFVLQATGEELDQHGSERGIPRQTGEADSSYEKRVQNLWNIANRPDIQALVDSLLTTGAATITEDQIDGNVFTDREDFVDRGQLITDSILSGFSVVIDNQSGSTAFYNSIYDAIEDSKAYGVMWRFLERS